MPTAIRRPTRTLGPFAAGALLVNAVPHAVKGLTAAGWTWPIGTDARR
ncbi:hypothetical protein [Nocardia asiatica]